MRRNLNASIEKIQHIAEETGFPYFEADLGSQYSKVLYLERQGSDTAPVEVHFHRRSTDEPWKFLGAIHRVRWTSPVYKANGGQPEITTMKHLRAYLSVLAQL